MKKNRHYGPMYFAFKPFCINVFDIECLMMGNTDKNAIGLMSVNEW
jgi:hypothetical protein